MRKCATAYYNSTRVRCARRVFASKQRFWLLRHNSPVVFELDGDTSANGREAGDKLPCRETDEGVMLDVRKLGVAVFYPSYLLQPLRTAPGQK